MIERRKHRRKEVNSRVRIFHPTFGSVDTQTLDISDGGVLLLSEDVQIDVDINDEVKLIFLDSGQLDIVFNMDVVRKNQKGVALKFLNYEKNGEICAISDLRQVWNMQV